MSEASPREVDPPLPGDPAPGPTSTVNSLPPAATPPPDAPPADLPVGPRYQILDVVAGKMESKSPAETCEFADLCAQRFKQRYLAAVRLYEKAFAADPKLADNLSTGHRYNAACCAAQAARGDGIDAPTDPADRAALRGKALAWLRADLTLRQKQAASADTAERKTAVARLWWWLQDADLAGTRAGALEEAAGWDEFWADVRAALADAQKP